MNTTVLYVEIIIAGIQSTIVLILIAISSLGYNNCKEFIPLVSVPANAIWLIALALIYPLGVINDRITNFITARILNSKIMKNWKCFVSSGNNNSNDNREAFLAKEEKEFKFLRHLNHRIRISRCTAVNFLAISILLANVIWRESIAEFYYPIAMLFMIMCMFIAIAAFLGLKSLNETYQKRYLQVRKLLVGDSDDGDNESVDSIV